MVGGALGDPHREGDPLCLPGEMRMKKYLIGTPLRVFLAFIGAIIWLGIALTGFGVVHWLLYLPAVFLIAAAATGICPGIIISNLLLGKKPPEDETG